MTNNNKKLYFKSQYTIKNISPRLLSDKQNIITDNNRNKKYYIKTMSKID